MKNNRIKIAFFTAISFLLLAGCADVGVASSWPGLSLSNDIGFFAYENHVFALDTRNGDELWRFPLEADNLHQFYASPAIGEDLVVVGSYGDRLVALDKQSGVMNWVFDGAADRYIGSALILNEMVYAPNTDHYLYALDSAGSLQWKFKADGPNWTVPLSDGNQVFLASMDHYLYAFRTQYAAAQLSSDAENNPTLLEEPLWGVNLNAAVVAQPVLVDGFIYVGTIEGKLHAVSITDERIAWTFSAGDAAGSIWGAPVVTDDAVFFGDQNGNLYAISRDDGSALWPVPYAAGAPLIAGGVEIDAGILYITDTGRVFTIDVQKEPRPVANLDMVIYASPVYGDGRLVIAPAGVDELFKAIDLDGNIIWNFIP